MADSGPPYFASDDHALLQGLLVGRLLEAGFQVEIVTDDEGNYIDEIEVMVMVVPYQPTRVTLKVMPPREPLEPLR